MKEKEIPVLENTKSEGNTSIKRGRKVEIKIKEKSLKKEKISFNPDSLIFPVF
jgi:hypothetical protein